ncbi:MAG TPA: PAS domain-containing protein [Terriglobales bacterium]|nr:PAS domain-containing protein [Terriglobales bacterium]
MPLRSIYKPESQLRRWGRRTFPYIAALLTSGAALGLSLLIPGISDKPFFVLFFIATSACAWLYGFLPACASVTFNALSLIYIVLRPAKTVGFASEESLIRLLVFIAASFMMAWLISKLKSTQQALSLAQERFELAHQIANIWSWELDLATGKVVWSSDPRDTAVRREDPVQVWLELVHSEDRERVLSALKRAVDTAQPYSIEFRIVLPDGRLRWVASSGEFYRSPSGEQRMIGVNIDITMRKQAESATEAAAKQEIAAELAHQINNPLQGLGHALYLLREQVAEAESSQYYAIARSEAERVSQLVKELLRLYPVPHG